MYSGWTDGAFLFLLLFLPSQVTWPSPCRHASAMRCTQSNGRWGGVRYECRRIAVANGRCAMTLLLYGVVKALMVKHIDQPEQKGGGKRKKRKKREKRVTERHEGKRSVHKLIERSPTRIDPDGIACVVCHHATPFHRLMMMMMMMLLRRRRWMRFGLLFSGHSLFFFLFSFPPFSTPPPHFCRLLIDWC